MINDTIGVDISKDHLDAHRMTDGASRRFANDRQGHQAFLTWRDGETGDRIVYEPTGPYHRAFERRLADAGCALVKVNPRCDFPLNLKNRLTIISRRYAGT